MKIFQLILISFLILLISLPILAQESTKPITKAEILQRLKPVPGKKVEQADLAGDIEARGIAFAADEKTLDEFRKAGARVFVVAAIQQAAENAERLKNSPPANPVNSHGNGESAVKNTPALITLWERARNEASDFVEDLPNFIVSQFVSRYVRPPGKKDWQADDKLEIELTYRATEGEKFKLLKINGRPTTQSYESIKGATSTGEFGSILASLFSPDSQAAFKEIRKEDFHGYKTALYEFSIKKANSSLHITDSNSGKSIVSAYQGTVWIDTESARVLRIEHSATDIQRGFPVTLSESAVEYDWVTISGKKYMVPVYAEMIIGSDIDHYYSRNVIELRNYRLFETDVKIIIEDPPKQ